MAVKTIQFAFVLVNLSLTSFGSMILLTTDNYRVFVVETDDCSKEFLGNTIHKYYDIARHPTSHEIFGSTQSGQLVRIGIPSLTEEVIGNSRIEMTALEFSESGQLYGASGSSVYLINHTNGLITESWELSDHISGGDLVVKNDSIYLTTRQNHLIRFKIGETNHLYDYGRLSTSWSVWALTDLECFDKSLVVDLYGTAYLASLTNSLNVESLCNFGFGRNDGLIIGATSLSKDGISFKNKLPSETLICDEQGISLGSNWSNYYSYKWSTGEKKQSIQVEEPGIYSVEIRYGNCVVYDSTKVAKIDIPLINSSDTVICNKDSISVNQVFGRNVSILNKNVNHWIKTSGIYIFQIDTLGCSTTDTSELTFINQVYIEQKDTLLCNDRPILVNTQQNFEAIFTWYDGLITEERLIRDSGMYTLRIKSICLDINDTFLVKSKLCQCQIHVPSAFTPNKDGINDDFKIIGDCEIQKFDLIIFNRWGEIVFRTNDPERSWDGTYQGFPVPVGVYFWHFQTVKTNLDLYSTSKSGFITVLN